MENRKNIKLISFTLFFIYLFVIANTYFRGPDEPIYLNYTVSVVEDGDLNIINQLYSSGGNFKVSKSFNFPDLHNHGGIILWIPFYSYGKFIYYLMEEFNVLSLVNLSESRVIEFAMSLSTIIFGVLTILFTFFLCRRFFNFRVSMFSILAIFFGTPVFYYTLFEVGNANLIAALFSVISVLFFMFVIDKNKGYWFLYGLFFSICSVIKVDLWFQIFFISFVCLIYIFYKNLRWRNVLYLFLGFLPIFSLRMVNDYLKYGSLYIGELGIMNLKEFYLFEQLFSSNQGFFYVSPIFYICFLGFILIVINILKNIKFLQLANKKDDIFIFGLALYLIVKIIIMGYRDTWFGGTFGARLLLTEFPVIVLLYAIVWSKSKRISGKIFLAIASILCVFWNIHEAGLYISRLDAGEYFSDSLIYEKLDSLRHIIMLLLNPKDLIIKLIIWLPLILLGLGIWKYIYGKCKFVSKQTAFKIKSGYFIIFTIYLCIVYIGITVMNFTNNKKNVEVLNSKGFFDKASIMSLYEIKIVAKADSMRETIEYFESSGEFVRAEKIKAKLAELYNEKK